MPKFGLAVVVVIVVCALFVKAGTNPIGSAVVTILVVCALVRAARRGL